MNLRRHDAYRDLGLFFAAALVLASPAAALEARDLMAASSTSDARACSEPSPPRIEGGRVVASPLPGMIQGYAAGTTGGLGRRLLLVRSTGDERPHPNRAAASGTLRWAVETAAREGGGWIRFDPALSGQSILLKRPLLPGSNTTIDGGCVGIRLTAPRSTMISVTAENVIISGLSFEQEPYQDAVDRVGDAISVGGDFDRVAVLHNSFRRCGDGCVDVARRERSEVPRRATIAFNRFEDHNKVILVGVAACAFQRDLPGCDPQASAPDEALRPMIFVTLQANLFRRTSQRNPRISSNAMVVMVNNLVVLQAVSYPDGRGSAVYGALASNGGILFARSNVFASLESRRGLLAAGTANALRPGTVSRDRPGVVVADDNIATDGLRVSSSDGPLPSWVPPPDVVRSIPVSQIRAKQFASCLERITGPGGLGLRWPDVCE